MKRTRILMMLTLLTVAAGNISGQTENPRGIYKYHSTRRGFLQNNDLFVDILKVGEEYIHTSGLGCDWFRPVKIECNGDKYWVDGKNVYDLSAAEQQVSTVIGKDTIKIVAVANYGYPIENEEGLTGCNGYRRLFMIADGKELMILKDVPVETVSKYFDIEWNGMQRDKITSLEKTDRGLELEIRSFSGEQNKIARYLLHKKDNCVTAKILDVSYQYLNLN